MAVSDHFYARKLKSSLDLAVSRNIVCPARSLSIGLHAFTPHSFEIPYRLQSPFVRELLVTCGFVDPNGGDK
jgi:hypothetical protein